MSKKRNRKAETIKVEGLSPDTIKEFAPKDDSVEEDKLWEEYFCGGPNILGFPAKQIGTFLPFQENEQNTEHHTTVGVPTAVTLVPRVVEAARVSASTAKKPRTRKEELGALFSTYTKSEQMVYSIMYRETISKGKNEHYFSLRKLMRKTGIGSDKTVFNALKGLQNKLSIQMVEHSNNRPIGTLYRVLRPKEIFKLRSERGIMIDIKTKRIVITAVV